MAQLTPSLCRWRIYKHRLWAFQWLQLPGWENRSQLYIRWWLYIHRRESQHLCEIQWTGIVQDRSESQKFPHWRSKLLHLISHNHWPQVSGKSNVHAWELQWQGEWSCQLATGFRCLYGALFLGPDQCQQLSQDLHRWGDRCRQGELNISLLDRHRRWDSLHIVTRNEADEEFIVSSSHGQPVHRTTRTK